MFTQSFVHDSLTITSNIFASKFLENRFIPVAQGVHDASPKRLYDPAEHALEDILSKHWLPAGHGTQSDSPVAVWYSPREHSVQLMAPAVLKVPSKYYLKLAEK